MSEMAPTKRETPTAYILWVASWFGIAGLHRLYLGRIGSGLIWLFTGGLCGIGTIVDAFLMPGMVDDANNGRSGF
ncbi:MAG: TM2 domain-containing membrane protein YozV [Cognaticolwellia sp.]|jgi:TM2 domain-containing membrane protein YozV